MDTRIRKACSNCSHSWLVESITPQWQGTKKELSKFERSRGRRWNRCYCGNQLY